MGEADSLGSAKREIEYVCVKRETVEREVPGAHDYVQDPLNIDKEELSSSEDVLEPITFNIAKTEDEEDKERMEENDLEELKHGVESASDSEQGSISTNVSEDNISLASGTGNSLPSTSKQEESCGDETGISHLGHRCDTCKKVFVHLEDLENHTHADSQGLEHLCRMCHKTFTTNRSLRRHLRVVHTGERRYSCDVCYKTFAENTALKHHLLLHTGERPHRCEVCSKTFIQRTQLKYHYRIHSGERPYKCDICNKTFIYKTHLNEHSWMHTGERPYVCGVCGKTFNQRSHLKRHLTSHTGMRPYLCGVCNKAFGQMETLKKHSRIHTGKCT